MRTPCGRFPAKGDRQSALPHVVPTRCAGPLRLRTGVAVLPRSDGTVQIGCAERGALRLKPPDSIDQRRCLALLSLLADGRTAGQLRAAGRLNGTRPQDVDELLRKIHNEK